MFLSYYNIMNVLVYKVSLTFYFFNPHLRICFSLILERKERGEGERERNIDWFLPIGTLTRDQTHSLVKCPERESNSQSFGLWDGTPTN